MKEASGQRNVDGLWPWNVMSYNCEHIQKNDAAGAKKQGRIEERLLRRRGGGGVGGGGWGGGGDWTMSSGGRGSGAHLGRVSV